MNTQFGMLVFAAVLLGSALPASARLFSEPTSAVTDKVMDYYGCTHFPTGGTVCEDDGYGPLEPRPRKK